MAAAGNTTSSGPKKIKFECPSWQAGQSCQRYMKVHWSLRFGAATIGASVPLVTAAKKLIENRPHPELEPVVWGIVFLLLLCSVVGIAWALHHEKDMPMTFITGLGLPALFLTLLTLV